MSESRSGQDADPLRPPFLSDTSTAPTIDPSVPHVEPTAPTELPQKIGRFLIRGFLGAGAFGTVYRAYDPQLEREVALKVAKAAGQSPERIQRFRREARAAAGLRHPHIVPLFEAGEVDGHLYLASAFVPGKTLEEAIAEKGGKLPPEQAAAIVRKLADALAYAHKQGVLHRDVKTANILLDLSGDPHLLDFGLARRTEDQERMTLAGAVLGTAAYLAPEAARGDQSRWTPAVDQYALGIVLYELLTGHPPFSGPIELVLALHQTQEAERPSRQNPAVPRDLEAICLKCLEKDPDHRYASAGDLAADLDRFRRGEPVVARRQTLRYLAGKFIRRYRRPLTVTAGVMLVAFIGVAAAFVKINAERDRAIEALAQAEQSSREAEESSRKAEDSARQAEAGFQEARLAVDDFLTELSQEGLSDVPGLQSARLKFAQKAAERYDRYATLRPNDSSVLVGQARSLTALGSMKGSIGSAEEARAVLQRAIVIGDRLVRENPGRLDHILQLARSQHQMGYVYWVLQKNDEAVPHLKVCIKALESIPIGASSLRARQVLANAYNTLGNTLRDRDPRESRQAFQRSREIAQQLRNERPNDPDCLHYLSPPVGNLAMAARAEGDYTEALRLENLFLELTDEALRLLPSSPNLTVNRAIGLDGKARALGAMGRQEEAIACCREAVAINRRVVADNPLVSRYQWLLAESLNDLADRLGSRSAESKPLLDEARRLLESLAGKTEDRVIYGAALVDSWIKIAVYHEFGTGDKMSPVERARARLRALEQAVREGRRLAAKHPRDREGVFKCSEALFKRGLFDTQADRHRDGYLFLVEAIDTFRALLVVSRRLPTPAQAEGLLMWCDQAQGSAEVLNRPEDGLRFGAVAAEVARAATTANALENLTRALNRAGKLHEKAGRYKKAIELYTVGVTAGRPVLDKHPWHYYLRGGVVNGYKNLALACQHEKDVRGELLAWREYMKTWLGPYSGMKIAEYVRPDAPMTEKEAIRVRTFVAKEPARMQRFTVPCDFNGIKYPFHIYVSNYVEPHDIIADQARWLSDVRGGTVPKEVLDSFKRLYKIAKENNVSFMDLCVYAFETAATKEPTNAAQRVVRIEKVTLDLRLEKEPKQDLPRLLRDVADLKSRLEGGPYQSELASKLILAYKELGEAYQKQGAHADAVASFAEAVRLVEARPVADQVVGRRLQADLYLLLGKAHDAAKDHERAELALRRHLSLLEEIAGPSPTAAQRALADEGLAALAGVIRGRGHLSEAARMCAPAVVRGSRPVTDAFVEIYRANAAVSGVLPPDLKEAFEKVVSRPRRDKKPGEGSVAADVFQALAAGHRVAAEGHRAAGRQAAYRSALAAEYDARVVLTRIDLKTSSAGQHKVATELALSYLADKETNLAERWADRASTAITPEWLLQLAEHIEKGTNTTADPKKAERWFYLAYYQRGKQLHGDRRYKEALDDLQKVCRMSRADGEDFNLLGMCQGKLGHWDEAVKAYQRSYQLRPAHTGNVLNLLEGLVISGQAKEACRLAAGLDKKIWSPTLPYTRLERRNFALMNGLHAIALRLTSDEPGESAAEKKLCELMADPGFKLTGWTWTEIDTWLAKVDIPESKKAAIRRLVEELKGNPPERSTLFFPLAVGAKWVYVQKGSDNPDRALSDVVIEVTAKEKMNGIECWKLVRTTGVVKTTEHLVVRYDGIYRMAVGGKPLATAHRILALPPERGRVWFGGANRMRMLPAQQIEVPAGKYDSAWVVHEEKGGFLFTAKPLEKVWYAEKVGPVKIETPLAGSAKGTLVLMLKSYQPPQAKPSD
jgi:tetratricopeptide (TPR) repeat protein